MIRKADQVTQDRPTKRGRAGLGSRLSPFLFILPPFLVYAGFVLYPLSQTIILSFTDWDGLRRDRTFIGLQNYEAILAHDPIFWRALSNNIWWVTLGTLAPIIIALPLAALLMSPRVVGRNVFRTIFFMPVILPAMVVGIIWGWIYNPVFGLVNRLLESVGLGMLTRSWLGDPSTALTALIFAAVWAYFGFCFVIFLAAIQNVDTSLLEAAEIDGASAVQRFFYVTIPQLRDVITMVGVYTFIGGFTGVFDIIWATTRGGPGNATEVLATYIYRQAFEYNEFGYAAALALSLALVVMVASFIIVRLRERRSVS